jgi:5-methylcytosine-specific restriction endonuclease McrA
VTSNLTKRKYVTKLQIVQYWIDWEKTNKEIAPFGDWDWKEPACMACSWFNEADHWEKSKLTKCHIVPRRLGGSDHVSNMVLMCDMCHSLQGDWIDPNKTFNYMKKGGSLWFMPLIGAMKI